MQARKSFLKRNALGVLVVVVIVLALLGASTLDQQAQEVERNEYCEMVKSGAWPDYRNVYKTECGD